MGSTVEIPSLVGRWSTPNGRALVPNGQRGVSLTTNPDSPWYEATFHSHGTTIKDVDWVMKKPAGSFPQRILRARCTMRWSPL